MKNLFVALVAFAFVVAVTPAFAQEGGAAGAAPAAPSEAPAKPAKAAKKHHGKKKKDAASDAK